MNSTRVSAYGHSDVGKVRDTNQDSIRSQELDNMILEHGFLYGIADGMGGYEHGGIASTLALETFFTTFYSGRPAKPTQNMKHGMDQANLAVCQTAQRLGARMGTTLSAINVVGQQLYVAHIGDSRVYLVRGRKATCLTNDHTAVGELVRMKLLSPDKVRTHERRSMLEKCLGMQLFIQPDITSHTLYEDDYLVLCTDGLWAFAEDEEIAQITRDVRQPELISHRLVDLAMERGSDDNVSTQIIHVEKLGAAQTNPEAVRGHSFTQLIRSRFGGKA
ncbi:MAG: protein phosphatase 2C domain-containing protein [Chloroflexota bacterium]